MSAIETISLLVATAALFGWISVRVLRLPDNFKTNWIDKGYPVE